MPKYFKDFQAETSFQPTDYFVGYRNINTNGERRWTHQTLVNSLPTIPTGIVAHFASTSAPVGWLECNGATIPNSGTTASLYAFLGSAGNPFGGVGKIPDLRGKFIRSNGSDGTYASGTFGATQTDLIKNHTHSGATDVRGDHVHTFSRTASIPTNSVGGQPEKLLHENTTQGVVNNWSANMNPTGNHAHNFTTGNPDSSLGGSETRPANVALLACIKL